MITRQDRVFSPQLLPQAALVSAFAFVAFATLISVFLAPKIIAFMVISVIAFTLCFTLSGNQRLFCVWGLVMTAPLTVSKNFFTDAHMGGASSIAIDLDDVFIGLLLAFIARDYITGRRRELRFSPILFWSGGMILLGVLDIVVGPMRKLALLEVVRMIKCYLLFFVVVNELVRVRQFMHFVAALATGVVIEAIVTIIQFTFKANLGLQFLGEPLPESVKAATEGTYLGHGDIFRAGGLLLHPNILAAFMAMLLPILIALFFSRIGIVYKAIITIIVFLGGAAMIITLSRSGWMSFGAAFLILMAVGYLHPRLRRRYLQARMLVIVIAAVGLALASGAIIKRITQSDPGAIDFRLDMMDTAWAMVGDHPLFGMGLNTFVPHMPAYSKYHGPIGVTNAYGKMWPVVHNSYLITWSEQGTVGFAFLMGMYLCVLYTGRQSARHFVNGELYVISIGATCGVVAIMIDGFGSFFIVDPASARAFWMVVGLIFAIHYWTKANAPLAQPAAGAIQLRRSPAASAA